jgi:predicted dehydrogenase
VLINRILIVGYGSIGKKHLKLAREILPQADIRVLRHKVHGDIPQYSNGLFFNIDEAINFAPQLAVIANPSAFHVSTAIKLASSGVHLLIEKPLSNNLTDVTKLLNIAHQNKIKLMTGYNLRFLPSLDFFRNIIKKKSIGKILTVHSEVGQYLPSWRKDLDYSSSVSANQKLGGGALLELSHEIDYLLWVFGEIDWVKSNLSMQSSLDIDVEDSVKIIMGFKENEDNIKLIASVNLDFIRHDTTRFCTAIGENGSLRWNGISGKVEIYESNASKWKTIFDTKYNSDYSYISEWKDFLECIQENKIPLVSGDDGLNVLKVIHAVKKSSKSEGQLIDIDAN